MYRLGEGPFRYEFVRLDLGGGLDVEHARFSGATRLVGTLAPDALHLLFPYGKDLRLSGVPVEQRLVVLSPPAVRFEGSTLEEGCGHTLAARGPAFAAATEGGLASRPFLLPGRTAAVRTETSAAGGLRQQLEDLLALADGQEDLLRAPGRLQRAREDVLEWLRLALHSLSDPAEPELQGPHPRRRALAVAVEEWVWRQLDDPAAPPVSLAAVARELDVSIRSIQLAVEGHLGVSFVRFARLVRLHQVHGALVSGQVENVSEAAVRHGFWHLGRFARYYRDVFGQRPSETARGARAGPPLSAETRQALMRRALEALRTVPP